MSDTFKPAGAALAAVVAAIPAPGLIDAVAAADEDAARRAAEADRLVAGAQGADAMEPFSVAQDEPESLI